MPIVLFMFLMYSFFKLQVSVNFGFHSSIYTVNDAKEKTFVSSRTLESPAFLLEEAIEEDIVPQQDVSDEMEEAVMVAFDRSGEGGELRIVTDPNEIKNIEIEEQERKRNVSNFPI